MDGYSGARMGELAATDLAVVIPTRQRWDILNMTLASLGRQTVSGFETIVVVDGEDQEVPELEASSVQVKRRAGPAAARNQGARSTNRQVILYLGDDTIPEPDLIERHLATHRRHPEPEAAAVGFVAWHDSVSSNKINAWLDWSGTQSWYDSLAPEGEQEVSHWHFYTSNVSVKREFLLGDGGFDEDFPYAAFEDIECAIRLSNRGMRLYYEPSAVCRHLHDYDWAGLERRFTTMAVSERLMVEMHPDVAPGCLNRMKEATTRRSLPVERLVGTLPSSLKPLDRLLRQQANRHYHQRLAPGYIEAWGRGAELCELRRYLGDDYDSARLVYGSERIGGGTDDPAEEQLLARARRALTGDNRPVLAQLQKHLPPASKVLDFRCGIGSEGLYLAERGFSVQFADEPGAALDYLKWRLAERHLSLPVSQLGVDSPPAGLDAAFCADASAFGRDPVETFRRMEELAPVVAMAFDPAAGDGGAAMEALSAGMSSDRVLARMGLPDGSRFLACS